jgi:hypothetical protein
MTGEGRTRTVIVALHGGGGREGAVRSAGGRKMTSWRAIARWRKLERERLRGRTDAAASGHSAATIAEALIAELDALSGGCRLGDPAGRIISGYWPIKGEPDLRPVAHASLIERGATVALPVVVVPSVAAGVPPLDARDQDGARQLEHPGASRRGSRTSSPRSRSRLSSAGTAAATGWATAAATSTGRWRPSRRARMSSASACNRPTSARSIRTAARHPPVGHRDRGRRAGRATVKPRDSASSGCRCCSSGKSGSP